MADVRLESTDARLLIQGLSKTFPGVRALADVDLEIGNGRIRALLGHNGSGKSTLIKVLAGVHRPDPGAQIWVGGEPFDPQGAHASDAGVRFVHQDLGVIDELSAVDNVALSTGYARAGLGRIDWDEQARTTRELLARFGIELDVTRPLGEATAVQRTGVAIVRALAGVEPGRGVLVLDEPTASLPNTEVDRLLAIVREVRASGTSVLYVSHRLDEIFQIADDVTVLRNGRVVASGALEQYTMHDLATAIAGREVDTMRNVRRASGEVTFAVRGLRTERLDDVSLELRRGEIVGVAGLIGSGRDDLPYVLAGMRGPVLAGDWLLDGKPLGVLDADAARAHGIALVPADRAHESILQHMNVRENFSLPTLDAIDRRPGRLSRTREVAVTHDWLTKIGVAPSMRERPIETLSGGNQQKVVLARWLSASPVVLLMAEPTAGVDLGARHALFDELRKAAAEGLAVMLATSDLDDLVSVCSRVLVMRDGRIAAELDVASVTREAIVGSMEGTDHTAESGVS